MSEANRVMRWLGALGVSAILWVMIVALVLLAWRTAHADVDCRDHSHVTCCRMLRDPTFRMEPQWSRCLATDIERDVFETCCPHPHCVQPTATPTCVPTPTVTPTPEPEPTCEECCTVPCMVAQGGEDCRPGNCDGGALYGCKRRARERFKEQLRCLMRQRSLERAWCHWNCNARDGVKAP